MKGFNFDIRNELENEVFEKYKEIITKEDIFSDFVFTVTLPINSSINYVKTSGSMRIED